jgi:hypothetical protein
MWVIKRHPNKSEVHEQISKLQIQNTESNFAQFYKVVLQEQKNTSLP